jgi:hypothetical protein
LFDTRSKLPDIIFGNFTLGYVVHNGIQKSFPVEGNRSAENFHFLNAFIRQFMPEKELFPLLGLSLVHLSKNVR